MNLLLTVLSTALLAEPGGAPTPDEMLAAQHGAAALFDADPALAPPSPGLEVVENWGTVQKNARYGAPFVVAGKTYERGLFCHAPSRIRVRLPGPGQTFTAVAAVPDALQWDVRDYPSGPIWPEVVFVVRAGDRELFRSEPVTSAHRGTTSSVPIRVDLGGAREFTLEAQGVQKGDHMAYLEGEREAQEPAEMSEWGEALWAEATVALEDGQSVALDELPLAGSPAFDAPAGVPFSFTYGDRSAADLLPRWTVDRGSRDLGDGKTERTATWTDPETGLEVRCVGVTYSDFPVVEWTVYFKNAGDADTLLLQDIRALDLNLTRPLDGEFVLHHSLGSSCRADDFRPVETSLPPGAQQRFAPVTGYASDPYMPYFNIELPGQRGVIVAVGWPGQWSAEFQRDEGQGLRVRAGQETTRFKLHPGEEVRTPLIALQFWRGGWIHSQNVWRRWMLAHNLPKPLEPIMVASTFAPLNYHGVTEENQKEFIDTYERRGLKLNWWWIDFGWHEGTWKAPENRFPNGLRPVTDYARFKGLKTIVWFAPEHSPLGGEAEWLLKGTCEEPLCRGTETAVLDLGNPDAWQWLVDMIDHRLSEDGIDCYRHDTSWGPLPNWRANDAPDRQGITENHYVSGYLAFYDELLRRAPGRMIDNCCRGGRRFDLETMRRSVPLWRSDFATGDTSQQAQTYGLALWVPMFGIGNHARNVYEFRSFMCPSTLMLQDVRRDDLDYDMLVRMNRQWWDIAPAYFGDYYPLTPYSAEESGWIAWQFDKSDTGEGFVQIFRRPGTDAAPVVAGSLRFRLQGLDPDARYALRDLDGEGASERTGAELTTDGIAVEDPGEARAWLFAYKRVE